MKNKKKKLLAIFAACMFAVMMMLNVTTSMNGTNFSIDGYTALVSGSTGESGTCCREIGSICVVGSNSFHGYYYKSEGSCND